MKNIKAVSKLVGLCVVLQLLGGCGSRQLSAESTTVAANETTQEAQVVEETVSPPLQSRLTTDTLLLSYQNFLSLPKANAKQQMAALSETLIESRCDTNRIYMLMLAAHKDINIKSAQYEALSKPCLEDVYLSLPEQALVRVADNQLQQKIIFHKNNYDLKKDIKKLHSQLEALKALEKSLTQRDDKDSTAAPTSP